MLLNVDVKNFHAALVQKGWTYTELSQKARVSRQSILQISKSGQCSLATAGRIARVLNIDAREFLK